MEGFADYIALVAWFEPNSGSTVPVGWGQDYETASLQEPGQGDCSLNKGIPLQVTKAFWDWDDANNEDGTGEAAGQHDEDSRSSVDIAKGWTCFEAGSGNRKNAESDRDGINVRDYIANTITDWWGGDSTFEETLLHHNCLTSQTDL